MIRRRMMLGHAPAGQNRVSVQSGFAQLVNASRASSSFAYAGSNDIRIALIRIGRTISTGKSSGIAADAARQEFWSLTGSQEKTEYYPTRAWAPYNQVKKLGEVFLYSGSLSAAAVAQSYAANVADVINIEAATKGSGYTNTYAPYIEAARVTSPDRTATIWVVTPLIDRDVVT